MENLFKKHPIPVEIPLKSERGSAEAFIRTRVRVNGHVTLEIVVSRELLAANGALIRLFLRMRHHVGFQSLVLREKGATHVAIELSVMQGETMDA